ncbi:MAG: ferredoxin:protochlorophyllide reductase (ATP-dependent) iron-sulfur ATP-binding protein, partial [Kamptonema sp. SIO4C4]|nr:ferredoxin:protochlorophyllide reductase (ATP-dependent) iron-sulfur ATP-binding protein [Kamptonema sp. SIO4C4]
QLLALPEGVVPNEAQDRDLFSLLSDYYLNPAEGKAQPVTADEEMDLMMV